MTINTKMNAAEMEAIAARHPQLIAGFAPRKRIPLADLCRHRRSTSILSGGSSRSARCSQRQLGHRRHLPADWVSYETRPDIKIADDGAMQVVYIRPLWTRCQAGMGEDQTRWWSAPPMPLMSRSSHRTISFMAPKSASAAARKEDHRRIEEVVAQRSATTARPSMTPIAR